MNGFIVTASLLGFGLTVGGLARGAETVSDPPRVIRLYAGAAPGSENWTHAEKESRTNLWQTRVVFNVASPMLTVFPADPANANGTAVVIWPGGAFFALSIDSEGYEVARAPTARGARALCSSTGSSVGSRGDAARNSGSPPAGALTRQRFPSLGSAGVWPAGVGVLADGSSPVRSINCTDRTPGL